MFAGLVCAERIFPLRRPVDGSLRRIGRNLAMGTLTGATLAAIEAPLTRRFAHSTAKRGWGLLPRLGITGAGRTVASLILLDYSLYAWHILLHRRPWLWRAHRVHHLDLDLDVTTAVRFHALEFLLSIPWRLLQIALIGATERDMKLWEQLTVAEVMFHHSNLRLPAALERRLGRLVATPSLHGIHHSTRSDERDSNFQRPRAMGSPAWHVPVRRRPAKRNHRAARRSLARRTHAR